MNENEAGKVVLISGASGSLGHAVAPYFSGAVLVDWGVPSDVPLHDAWYPGDEVRE